jgi:hypothetical protein
MSTIIVGETSAVFDAFKEAFQSAAALGDVVMVASFSNCCPLPARPDSPRKSTSGTEP